MDSCNDDEVFVRLTCSVWSVSRWAAKQESFDLLVILSVLKLEVNSFAFMFDKLPDMLHKWVHGYVVGSE